MMENKPKKPLKLATSIDELDLKYTNVDETSKNKKIELLITSMSKMILKAEEKLGEGDEESSYVLYMKFFNLMTHIQKKSDFDKVGKKLVSQEFNNKTLMIWMEKLSILRESLSSRYKEQYKNATVDKMPAPNVEAVNIHNGTAGSNKDHMKNDLPADIVTCEKLYDMIFGSNPVQVLIMDCRPRNDYLESKMDYKYSINVPEEIIMVGLSANKIRESLPNDSSVYWELRSKRTIVIVDWESKNFERNSTPWHLNETLRLYDPENENYSSFILQGGYELFKTQYPMKCFNPNYSRPKPAIESELDKVEYPDSELSIDINNKKGPPQIDRSVKKNAIEKYKNKSEVQLLEETITMANKSLQNVKDMLMIEESFKNDEDEKENETPEMKQQMYKMYELETIQKDIAVKESTLTDFRREHKKAEETEEVKSKVKSLEEQLEKIKAEDDRLKAIRAQKMKTPRKASNENEMRNAGEKRHRMNNRNEVVLTPRLLPNVQPTPTFDRSTKPKPNVEPLNEQDFSPIRGKIDPGLCGLKNLGNTCYMNSVIQCLSNTFLLRMVFFGDYEKEINWKSPTKGGVIRCTSSVIKMLWNGDFVAISPLKLKILAENLDSLFIGDYQQDAHEFLILMIDWMQTDLQTIPMPPISEKIPASEKAWLEYTNGKESIIHRIFYGQMKSTLKCSTCRKESATFEAFSNLSLELPSDNIQRVGLEDCFMNYFHEERIDGWTCPDCKEPRSAIKKLSIAKLPPVLIIHLKRFQKQDYSSVCRKNNIFIDFPLERLNLLHHVCVRERKNISHNKQLFTLFGVSNHYGRSMESGHYTAFCKHSERNRWFKFDDQNVSSQEPMDVVSSAAYVLFYTNYNVPTKN